MLHLKVVSQRHSPWRINAVDDSNKEGGKQEPLVPKKRSLGWLRKAPRIRYRLPENRCPDQLLELTVLNERLLGSSPWEVRRKVEYLKKKQEHWDVVYEIIVKRGAAATLKTIEEACNKVEVALSEQSKESKSLVDLKKELIDLQKEVKEAHEKLHFTQSCVLQNLNRIQKLKSQIELNEIGQPVETTVETPKMTHRRSHFNDSLMDYWYPIAFSSKLEESDTMIPFELFGQPWVLFRDEFGNPACVQDECAHRACPLSIGKVVDGRISCPYHGWKYNGTGSCVKMPSTVYIQGIAVNTLPSLEKDGFIWVWPGTSTPPQTVPGFAEIPPNFEIISEVDVTVPVDQSFCLSNLLDEERSPFYPFRSWLPSGSGADQRFESSFDLPCCVTSVMSTSDSSTVDLRSVEQLHVCLPVGEGRVRILHRTSSNFGKWMTKLPFTRKLFERTAVKALNKDMTLTKGKQDRMKMTGSHTEPNLAKHRNTTF